MNNIITEKIKLSLKTFKPTESNKIYILNFTHKK